MYDVRYAQKKFCYGEKCLTHVSYNQCTQILVIIDVKWYQKNQSKFTLVANLHAMHNQRNLALVTTDAKWHQEN